MYLFFLGFRPKLSEFSDIISIIIRYFLINGSAKPSNLKALRVNLQIDKFKFISVKVVSET